MRLHTAFGHNMYRTDYYSKKDLGCPKAFLTIVLTYIFLELLWRIPKRAKDNHWLIGWIIDHLGTYLCHRNRIVNIPGFWQNPFITIKVKTLWEGQKIWKNLPPVLTKQLFILSNIKTGRRLFQIFVAVSEKLNFT